MKVSSILQLSVNRGRRRKSMEAGGSIVGFGGLFLWFLRKFRD